MGLGLMKRLDQGHLHPLLEHPETNMSRPGIEQASQASNLAKSYSNSLLNCYSEPLQSLVYSNYAYNDVRASEERSFLIEYSGEGGEGVDPACSAWDTGKKI
jgi:hypothetical protein